MTGCWRPETLGSHFVHGHCDAIVFLDHNVPERQSRRYLVKHFQWESVLRLNMLFALGHN